MLNHSQAISDRFILPRYGSLTSRELLIDVQGASRQKNWDLGVSLNPRAVARAGIANQSLTGLLQRIPGSASMLIRHSPDS